MGELRDACSNQRKNIWLWLRLLPVGCQRRRSLLSPVQTCRFGGILPLLALVACGCFPVPCLGQHVVLCGVATCRSRVSNCNPASVGCAAIVLASTCSLQCLAPYVEINEVRRPHLQVSLFKSNNNISRLHQVLVAWSPLKSPFDLYTTHTLLVC